MTEQMLREALHDAMTAGAAPPPMSSTVMVRVARRARNPCRVGWSGASCAALVATIAVTASVLPRPPAGISTGLSGGAPAVAPVYAPATAQAWPTGPDGTPQENRTATAGPRYEQGLRLLDALVKVVPAGFAVPDQPDSRTHQAQFADRVGGVEVWEYLARIGVTSGGGTGQLVAEVHTAGNALAGGPCQLTEQFWGMRGTCQVLTVGPRRSAW